MIKKGQIFPKKRKESRFNQKIMAFQEITKTDHRMGHRQSKVELKDSWHYDRSGSKNYTAQLKMEASFILKIVKEMGS